MSGKNRINKDHYTQDGKVLRGKGDLLQEQDKQELSRTEAEIASGAAAQRGRNKRKQEANSDPLIDTSILHRDDENEAE
ncbi:MAG: hypothetical protein MUD01_26210 [Chloroflexaceae bacterium]|jgi:hypothetical protein|nr:hypothetical protein [Chloroflexaceae bacterium]